MHHCSAYVLIYSFALRKQSKRDLSCRKSDSHVPQYCLCNAEQKHIYKLHVRDSCVVRAGKGMILSEVHLGGHGNA